ncbi:hypothetical protein LOD99_9769 [Oopsacas minuta]|uniref:Cation/H+ exchanger transmembrane domain-containing protein n=1 Tax=Oopsacas minuta TaxID=111878 RepID=A0AAV7KTP2_9METZ|nr:hypothetical protein LOD99_9769 [Oopsacas minuta]
MDRNSRQSDLEKYSYQLKVLSLLSIDLEIADSVVTAVTDNFKHTISEISRNVKSVELIMHVSKTRLDLLRDHVLTCEEEYSEIHEFLRLSESHQKANHLIQSKFFAEQILGELFVSADQLQEELHHDLFDQYKLRSHSIETVIKISLTELGIEPSESINYIIDTKNDLYVLSRPDDPTVSIEDMRLVCEISLIFILSSILSIFFLVVGIPHLVGPILIGMILGPSGLNVLTSLVQIQSLAEFGVFFILFSFGFEFSPENLRKGSVQKLLALLLDWD